MNKTSFRRIKNDTYKLGLILLTIISTVPFLLILFFIIKNGIAVINWEFLTSLPKPIGENGGGIINGLIGTGILIVIATIIAIPIGIITGIYLAEYPDNLLSNSVRIVSEIFQGVPSIVVGIIAYFWLVKPMGHFSALSGGFALALILLPMIIKSTEEMVKLVPADIKEASLSLGVPYYRSILKVIIPASLSGILTGALTGIARISGETAPLLFTAFGDSFFNVNILKPIASLPLLIFNYSISPYEAWWAKAWGVSFLIVIFILILNILTRILYKKI
jgi:phosphate transport system permease protein